MSKHPDDGKFVVVQGDQRMSGQLHEAQQSAQSEADKAKAQQPVTEGQPATLPPRVVQNLYG